MDWKITFRQTANNSDSSIFKYSSILNIYVKSGDDTLRLHAIQAKPYIKTLY